MPKKGKSRTQNKFENAAISCIRKSFTHYSPKYGEVWEAARIEQDKYNKDGSLSKEKAVFRKCEKCGKLEKNDKADVDHKDPVVEIGKTRHDYTLGEYVDRIDCDVNNLWVLCEGCHNKKTAFEREERKKAKALKKKTDKN